MRYLSKYLTYERAVFSSNALSSRISNVPSDKDLKALVLLGENVYDKVCDRFGRVFASSVFRSASLQKDRFGKMVSVNGLAGGSPTSGHVKGEAIDIDGDSPDETSWVKVDNNALFKWIKDNLEYDQLIAEYEANGAPKWCHVGFRSVGNRQQTLIATKNSAGNTVYMIYSDSLYRKIYRGSRDFEIDVRDVGFEMPATDFQTSVDETHEEGWEQEFEGNRAAPEALNESVDSNTGTEKPTVEVSTLGDGTVVIKSGDTEIRVVIESH